MPKKNETPAATETIKEQWNVKEGSTSSDYQGHFRVAGRVVRVTLHWDHHYSFQTHAYVEERLAGGEWVRVGHLLEGNREMGGQWARRREAMGRDRDTLLELVRAVVA